MNPFTQVSTLVNFADASTTLQQVQTFSIPLFAATVVFAAVIVGIMVGGLATRKVVGSVGRALRTAMGLGGRRGGRRRRR